MEDAVYEYTVSLGLTLGILYCKTGFSLMVTRDTLDKLIQTSPASGSPFNSLPIKKDPPPPLDQAKYSHIRFWTAKSFDAHFSGLVGETDGLATKEKRRGRHRNADKDEDRHPYLETVHGTQIPRETLVKVGQKARRLWQALNTAGLAPPSWGKANEVAYTYFHGEMLNDPEFEFFRYCEGNWKITRWATKAYASWKYNHLRPNNAEDGRTSGTNKRKRELLDDPSLLQIEHEMPEATPLPLLGPSESASESTPVTTHRSASITSGRSNLDLTQVRSHFRYMPTCISPR